MNHVIKLEVEWKENKLPMLVEHLKAIASQHESELEKAVIGRGEWKFTASYLRLQVDEKTWFSKMNLESRRKHMKMVKSCTLVEKSAPSVSQNQDSAFHLSVSVDTLHAYGNVSFHTLQCIWEKATMLLATTGNVISIPWSDNPKGRLVRSSSSEHPHIVNVKKDTMYFCDENCSMYKGYRVCSHVIATAEDNGELEAFLKSSGYLIQPNLTMISNRLDQGGKGANKNVNANLHQQLRVCLFVHVLLQGVLVLALAIMQAHSRLLSNLIWNLVYLLPHLCLFPLQSLSPRSLVVLLCL